MCPGVSKSCPDVYICVCGPQGVSVLLFHCALNTDVRRHLRGVLSGKKPHPDDSATTKATLLTVGPACGCPPRSGCGPCRVPVADRAVLCPQRSLNCNNTYSEDPGLLRTALGESTASLDSAGRSVAQGVGSSLGGCWGVSVGREPSRSLGGQWSPVCPCPSLVLSPITPTGMKAARSSA